MSHNFVVDKYHLYRHAWIFDSSPDKETKLTEQQYSIMLANGGFMVRNTYDFDCNVATSFWYVIKDSYSGWSEFGKSTKNCINRAKRKLCFKIVDKECILKYGYDIIEDSTIPPATSVKKMEGPIEALHKRKLPSWTDFTTGIKPLLHL